MAAEEKAEASSGTSAPSGGGSKLVMILTIVNLLLSGAVIGILFLSFQKESHKPGVEDIVAGGDHGAEGGHGEAPAGDGHGGAAEKGDGHGGAAGGGHKKTTDFGKMIALDQFTVNLTTPGSVNPKYVRVNISLELPNADSESEVTQKMPQVRNAIIDLFNSKRPADLSTAEGRDYLKEEIRNALNGFLVTGKVKGVFFTNFAVGG